MAATLTPQAALDYAKEMIKKQPLERVWALIAQQASNYIWIAAPWRWTIGTLAPITLTSGLQSFNVVTEPTDLVKLERAYIMDGTSVRPVTPVSAIPASAIIIGNPNFVSYTVVNAGTDTITFDSLYPDPGVKTPQFQAWYKKSAPLLASVLNTPGALVMDDDYFQIFAEWALYYAYRYSDDQRAGSATVAVTPTGKQMQYSGQLGVAQAALEDLRQQETVIWQFPTPNPSPMKDR